MDALRPCDGARGFGVSEAIIGLTIVALGTSMPDLVTCIVAACKKEPDIALGNIIGSNIFNLLGILGAAALIRPMTGEGIKMTDLYVTIAFAAALVPILWSGRILQRWEAGWCWPVTSEPFGRNRMPDHRIFA